MSKAKVAVLHGGLLARKGEARPMSTFAQPTTLPHLAQAPRNGEPARPEPQLRDPVRHIQDDQAPQRQEPVMSDWSAKKTVSVDQPQKCGGCEPTLDIAPALSEKTKTRGKAKTELHARLDSMSHKRLKIAAAQLGRSQQELVTAAIDAFLDNLEDNAMRNCSCMQNARG
jgi:predicted DNA-binding protein